MNLLFRKFSRKNRNADSMVTRKLTDSGGNLILSGNFQRTACRMTDSHITLNFTPAVKLVIHFFQNHFQLFSRYFLLILNKKYTGKFACLISPIIPWKKSFQKFTQNLVKFFFRTFYSCTERILIFQIYHIIEAVL